MKGFRGFHPVLVLLLEGQAICHCNATLIEGPLKIVALIRGLNRNYEFHACNDVENRMALLSGEFTWDVEEGASQQWGDTRFRLVAQRRALSRELG